MNWNFFIINALDVIQWFAMLVMTLTLFRLKPAGWWRQNVLLALALKAVTLAVKTTAFHPYLSLVQLAVVTLAFFLFYRIRLDCACIIAAIGGIIEFVSVIAVNFALASATRHTFAEVMYNNSSLSLYFASAVLLTSWTLFIAWALKRLRLGFSFVTTSYRQMKPNMRLFGIPLTILLAGNVVLPPAKSLAYTPLLLILVCVCLLMLLLASLRTELKDDAGTQIDSKKGQMKQPDAK